MRRIHLMVCRFAGLMMLLACCAAGVLAQADRFAEVLQELQSPDGAARTRAVIALEQLGDPRAVDSLVSVLVQDENPMTRAQAALTLGKLGDKKAVPMLIAALKDDFVLVRNNAVLALGRLKAAEAI